jgi:hypothetical protein
VDGIELKIEIECDSTESEFIRDVHGNIELNQPEEVEHDQGGVAHIFVDPKTRAVTRRYIHPYVRFTKE